MNSTIYNLSVIILLLGFTLAIHYYTKIYYKQNILIQQKSPKNIYSSKVYQQRPKSTYNRMFDEIGPWIDSRPNPLSDEPNPKNIKKTDFYNLQNI